MKKVINYSVIFFIIIFVSISYTGGNPKPKAFSIYFDKEHTVGYIDGNKQ